VSAYRPDGAGGNCLDPDQAGSWPDRAIDGSGSGGSAGSIASSIGGLLLPAPPTPSPAAAVVARGGGGWGAGRHRKVKGQLAGGTSVLVGALHGSLYALPADHLMLMSAAAGDADGSGGKAAGSASAAAAAAAAAGGASTALWPRRQGRLPLDITPAEADMCTAPKASSTGGSGAGAAAAAAAAPAASQDSGGGGGSASGVLAVPDDLEPSGSVVALNPADSGAVMDELGKLTCPQPPLGIHPLVAPQPGGGGARQPLVGWLPLGAAAHEDKVRDVGVAAPGAAGDGVCVCVCVCVCAALLRVCCAQHQ
jgi:hypothetical protein